MISDLTPHILSCFRKQALWTDLFFLAKVDLVALKREIEKEESLVHTYLCQQESEQFAGYTYPKRRYEWLGGRIAAKYAAWCFFADSTAVSMEKIMWKDVQVCQNKHKRPYLYSSFTNKGLPHVSISHSHTYALAMASGHKCGVDIQEISETIERVQGRFLTLQEQKMLLRTASHSESRRYYLTMLWSAKEAIKKSSHMQPLPGFLEITLCSIDKIDENGFHLRFKLNKQKGDTFYNVFALPYLSSAIALTLNTEDFPCSR